MMSVMKRAAMLLMLAAISANMASDPENCGSLRATVSPNDHPRILGDWVLVESYSSSLEANEFMKNLSSSHVELRLLTDNKIMYTESNMYKNKSCVTFLSNTSIPSDPADHVLHLIVPSLLDQDGVVIELNDTANVTFHETCANCLILVFKGELGQYLLTYRREGHHHDVDLLTADHNEHKKLAECLGILHDNEFGYNSTADLCHKKSSPEKIAE